MKVLNWIAWISGGIGALLLLLGSISALIGRSILPAIAKTVNYFSLADSFFLLTIALFIFLYRCQCKKE